MTKVYGLVLSNPTATVTRDIEIICTKEGKLEVKEIQLFEPFINKVSRYQAMDQAINLA